MVGQAGSVRGSDTVRRGFGKTRSLGNIKSKNSFKDVQLIFLLHLQLLEISMQWLLKDDGHLDFLGKTPKELP